MAIPYNGTDPATGNVYINGVLQTGSNNLQGSATTLQGSSPTIQGSSPTLQNTISTQQLQPAAGISVLSPTNTISTAPKVTATPTPTVSPSPAPAPAPAPAPVIPDRTNDINQNMSALDATKTLLSSGLSSVQNALSGLLGRYGTEAAGNESAYGDQSVSNKQGYLKGVQTSLLNAAQGRQGLFGVLSSLGALNGSGIDLANRAVQGGANSDIAGANDIYATNQSGLDTGIKKFRDADQIRRDEAARAAEDAQRGIRSDVAQKQQTIYGNLSNDYADMQQADKAKQYSDLLAALFPEIATNIVPTSGPTYQGANYVAPSLADYLSGGTSINSAPVSGISGLPGLTAYIAPTKRRDA